MEKLEVEDLFTDLSDGKKLLRLLEIISGEKLGKVNTSRHRIHKIENVNKSLAFLHTKVKLESIGSEDIVDGKPQLILGLIWTIILRFQIQPIRIPDADDENSEKKSARDALLLWCQSKTKEYPTVNITDFSNSWRNGLAFNALIHAHCPELLDFYRLDPNDHFHNLNHAFEVAQNELSIPQLLDAEDLVRNKEIDEKCVLTYVASYYHCLTKRRQKEMEGRRIANIIRQLMRTDAKKMEYEQAASRLLAWIQAKVTELRRLEFPNSLEGIQGELLRFKEYRTVKKPPKYRERSDVEELLFLVQTQVKALGQPLYVPPEGVHVHDIERAWAELEKAEHQRELALRKELLHQEYLENLAYKFLKKITRIPSVHAPQAVFMVSSSLFQRSCLNSKCCCCFLSPCVKITRIPSVHAPQAVFMCMVREGYLKEMTQVLADPSYGSNLGQVEATIKKHEALSADIHLNWVELGRPPSCEMFREQNILLKWQQLLDWLEKHRQTLSQLGRMMALIRELETLSGELTQLEAATASPDLGKHVQAVEDLLEGHTLLEAQISSHGDAITRLNTHQDLVTGEHAELFQRKLQRLNQDYQNLVEMAAKRRGELLLSRTYLQFVQDQEEAEAWVVERQRICRADVPSRGDLPAAQSKHLALEQEIQGHWPLIERVLHRGEELPQSLGVKPRISSLRQSWELLQDLWKQKCRQLEEACLAFQVTFLLMD
ncbi:SPTBN5 [Cordylochernes scorpioides]|uniref:SPTBN5 n=1 Tax=Cordylochernes scorpioides TaxID=51811 RepID=A0ABY6JZQ9_9ARAC|nr:SPTBN5 [Cordylochernes scorpioides]